MVSRIIRLLVNSWEMLNDGVSATSSKARMKFEKMEEGEEGSIVVASFGHLDS